MNIIDWIRLPSCPSSSVGPVAESKQGPRENAMGRDVYVLGRDAFADRAALATKPGAQTETVSPLDLPPAVVYAYECGDETRWITDPVEVVRLRHLHPEAQVRVLATERLRRPH
jgi:hypothetical protein